MKLNKSHKDKIIGGIIGIIILFFTLYVKECFEKRSPKPDPQQTNSSTSIKSEDSSTQTIIQSPQNNYNTGNVSNEYVGTKNVTQYQTSSNRDAKQPQYNIEGNNGSNINTGNVNGNLTQTVNNPLARNLTKEQSEKILLSIPSGYTVEIRYPYPDQEADGFSNQIMDLLSGSDRKVFKTRHHNIVAATGKDFDIKPYPDKPDMMILTVYPQK